ncbi:MAG TPA: hypothetical protein VN372_11545 [Methanospirillum sp.]|nr:hypothetical protein [Methanospirillum sp.]
MNRTQTIFIMCILAGCALLAGCTSTPQEPVQTLVPTETPIPISTPVTPTPLTPTPTKEKENTIFDGPLTEPPEDLAVSVSLIKDPVYSTITATFDGGKGQELVQKIDIRTTLSTGEVLTDQLGMSKGKERIINGTRDIDRVQVAVTYMTGGSYLIADRQLGQSRIGKSSDTLAPESTTSPQEGMYAGPVTEPPNSLSVSVEVNKEPIYRVITGTFRGGHGQSLVSKIEMHAMLGDGETVTRPIANNIGAIAEIQGSDKTDRVQVVVYFKNGDTYKIVEKVFGPRG